MLSKLEHSQPLNNIVISFVKRPVRTEEVNKNWDLTVLVKEIERRVRVRGEREREGRARLVCQNYSSRPLSTHDQQWAMSF